MRHAAWTHPGEISLAVRRSAERYLDELLQERTPGFDAPTTPDWAAAFLAAFRRFRETQRGGEAQQAAQRLGLSAAADPHRFFWEFWQNADDAGATQLTFVIDDARLTITNDGAPFGPTHVFSLLMVARSTKGLRDDQIGQFGVGSLALMRFSDAPIYQSGHYNFTLEHSYTYPGPASSPAERYVDGLVVFAPLRPNVNPDDLYEGLAALSDGEALLYMRSLQQVTVSRDGGETKTINAQVEHVQGAERVIISDRTWLRYQRDVLPPTGMHRDAGRTVANPVNVTLIRDPLQAASLFSVYAYFPTQLRHRYPWRFSAPFDVTTGREGLIESSFNRWLLREVGRLMVEAAPHPVAGNPAAPWTLVPQSADETTLLAEVWNGALEEMRAAAWLPGGSRLIHAREAAFAETEEIRPLLRAADLTAAAGGPRQWVRGVPPAEVRPALEAAGAFRVCCHTLSAILAAGPLGRGPDWYLRSLAATITVAELRGDDTVHAHLVEGRCMLDRRRRPFSLIEVGRAGKVVCNTRSEVLSQELGGLFPKDVVVLLHKVYRISDRRTESEDDAIRSIVDSWLRANSSDSTFAYERALDAPAFIRHFIVDRELAASNGDVADHLLRFVRDHVDAYVSEAQQRRRQILIELGRRMYVKAHQIRPDGKRVTAYVPISVTYFPARLGEQTAWAQAARGVPGLWWLDSSYGHSLVRKDNPVGVARFLRELGAAVGPRVQPTGLDARHGTHHFQRVTHSDHVRFPCLLTCLVSRWGIRSAEPSAGRVRDAA